MLITLKTLPGRVVHCEAWENMTVADLRLLAGALMGLDVDYIAFIHKGIELRLFQTLHSAGVASGDTIYIRLSMRGD